MNPLNQYPALREKLYLIQFLANLVLGALGVAFAAINGGVDEIPQWYIVTSLVANFVWSYLGLTAKQNVDTTGPLA